ncbi:MAG TPA: ATP-binding protein [Steroidobacteraceae bacterium]|jgi:PAS domain S-box-containing protein
MLAHVTVIWSAATGAALLLGIVHALVWVYDRRARGNLAFALAAIGLAAASLIELEMLHAKTPQQWGELVWWLHIPMFLLVSGMACFLWLYLDAGRRWLLAAVVATRLTILMLNFFSEPNFNFQSIDAIGKIAFLGEQVTIVTSAVTGKYQWLALVASVFLPLFIVDVVVTLWRRGTAEARRRALVVGGPVFVSVLLSFVLTQLVIWRVVQLPILLVPPFFIAVAAMSLEVSRDVVRAAGLARDLRVSEQRLELAANAAGAGLWSWDSSSKRVWATERARAILCLDPAADLRSEDVLRFVDQVDLRQLRATLRGALEHGGEHALHFRIVTPDGSVRWIAAHGAVEKGVRGKSALIRGVVRDVTAQRRAEDEAGELHLRLAHASRVTMLGQLSAALAHEIAQPLSAIQQNSETAQLLLARERVDIDELRAVVDDIVRDNHRATEVVHRLRTWLKQGHMRRETVSLESIAQDVLALVRSEASMKRIAIDCAMPRTLPPICGDRVHLSQVLLNLVMNAMDASTLANDACQRVSISASVIAATGCCDVCVSDTGSGIPPDQLNRIFEPFVTSKSEGMGMGLSISRAIVEAHGGKMWAENEACGGAAFHFTVRVDSGNLPLPA